ncbi:chain-length determining protein [Chakrabartia godavariana]|nr:chain-length determining protein [Chakrabartia godavariana]
MGSLYQELLLAVHGVWRRRWVALGVTWAVCLIGWIVVSMMPNRYESQARVFVQMQSLLSEKIGVTPNEQQRDIDRVKRTLTSTVNLEKVVRGTELANTVSTDKEVTAAASGLRDAIKVTEQQENLFEIKARLGLSGHSDAENAKLARAVVQKMIDIFVEENMSGDRRETSQSLRFLDQQIVQKEEQLRAAEARRVDFERNALGLLPGVGSVQSRMEAARAELNQIDSNLMSAQGSLAAVNGQLAGIQPTISMPGLSGGGDSRVAILEGQIADAQARGWTDSHPDMQALRSQLARARATAPRGGGGGYATPNPAFTSLRAMQAEKQAAVGALAARKAQLQAELSQYAARQIEQPGAQAEQDRLSRDYEAIKLQYDKLLADREAVRLRGQVASSTDSVAFRIIDPPSSPRQPVAPDRPTLMFGVLIAGLLAGVGTAFALSQLNSSFASPQKLAAVTGMPVIGSVSEVVPAARKPVLAKRQKLFLGGLAGLAGVFLLLVVVDMVQRSGVA